MTLVFFFVCADVVVTVLVLVHTFLGQGLGTLPSENGLKLTLASAKAGARGVQEPVYDIVRPPYKLHRLLILTYQPHFTSYILTIALLCFACVPHFVTEMVANSMLAIKAFSHFPTSSHTTTT